jgi:hypothetical protein
MRAPRLLCYSLDWWAKARYSLILTRAVLQYICIGNGSHSNRHSGPGHGQHSGYSTTLQIHTNSFQTGPRACWVGRRGPGGLGREVRRPSISTTCCATPTSKTCVCERAKTSAVLVAANPAVMDWTPMPRVARFRTAPAGPLLPLNGPVLPFPRVLGP